MSVLLLLALGAPLAAPPLVPAADVAEADLQAWWREGDLLVGVPTHGGRLGVRPLVSLAPLELPRVLDGWTPIGERCERTPSATAVLDGETVDAGIEGAVENPIVVLRAGGRVLASSALGRPVRPCALSIVQADSLPGLEIVVAWRQGVDGPDDSTTAGGGEASTMASKPAASEDAASEEAASEDAQPATPSPPSEVEIRGITVFRIPDTAR